MKKIILISCLALACSIAMAEDKPELSIAEVTRNVYCVTHAYPWPANSLIAVMDDKTVVIIDTPYTPDAMEEELRWIRARFGEAKIVAINTHFHVDRLGGNAALIRNGIPIYGSELTIRAIKERGKRSSDWTASGVKNEEQRNYYAHFEYTPPDNVFDSRNGLTLRFGSEEVIVRYHGVGHSVDNLFVFLPSRKVLFGGCAILSAGATRPGNVADGDIGEWKKTLDRIDVTGYTYIIPGHGKIGGTELIEHTKELCGRGGW